MQIETVGMEATMVVGVAEGVVGEVVGAIHQRMVLRKVDQTRQPIILEKGRVGVAMPVVEEGDI